MYFYHMGLLPDCPFLSPKSLLPLVSASPHFHVFFFFHGYLFNSGGLCEQMEITHLSKRNLPVATPLRTINPSFSIC